MKEMPKTYDHQIVESKWYEKWEKNGYFHAEPNPEKTPFTIVIPPPNITGKLHMGHALDNTLQDAIARYKRMSGYEMLWLPGTDHASIATEVKIVEALAAEGLTKKDVGREGFLKRAWQWREEYGSTIVKQLRKMGSSCDWERERFTMDEGCNKAVVKVFKSLYDKKLIYRGDRIINWCPDCKTALSDAEVEYETQASHLWHIRYDAPDKSYSITVATTRPETMLGDTAIAVNPEDERYKDIIGKTVILPLVNREIPIVGDEYCEMEFGTGAVKITPAHDPNDFEVGQRHGLPILKVFDEKGYINENGGQYCGQERFECRKNIVADLEWEPGEDRGLHPQRGHLLPLPHHHRDHRVQAVVRGHEAPHGARFGGGALRSGEVHPRTVQQALLQLDGEHPGLVHLPPALVGPSDPRILLRRLRRRVLRGGSAGEVPHLRR